MITEKDCPRWLARVMASCLGVFLALVQAGCSGISGFRSVGTERPSLLDFWERPAGSPSPEDDLYAMSMREGQMRAAELAKRNDKSSRGAAGDPASGGDKVADASTPAHGRQQNGAESSVDADDTTIRVSLGRPEPLPDVALALASAGRGASTGTGSTQWKADNEVPSDSLVADLSGPAKHPGLGKTEPVGVAKRQQSSHQDGWKDILTRAESKLYALQTYQMRVSRLERVNGQLQPQEDILLSIRRQPKAVRLEWTSGPSKGREVIYSSARDPRMIFVHMASTAIPLPVMKFPVDSPLVMRNSRHAITEAGLDTILENLRKAEGGAAEPRSTGGKLSYRGTEKPAGVERTCHHFVRTDGLWRDVGRLSR